MERTISFVSVLQSFVLYRDFSKNIECSQGTSVYLRELHPALCCG